MNKIFLKKGLLLLTTSFVLITTNSNHYIKINRITNDNIEAFAKYSNGYIYIGDKEYLNNLTNIKETDVLIEDQRSNKNDPDMIIHDSYKIVDENIMYEIINIICDYEELNPSNWNRSKQSMKSEWLAHNLSYYLNYKRNRTADVDLNNNDEEKYSIK